MISHAHQTEALLLPLLLSQEQRHLQGVLLLQTLHALQHVCAPQVLLCAQNKHTDSQSFFFNRIVFRLLLSLQNCKSYLQCNVH